MTLIELREPAHLVSPRARAFWTVRALPGWIVIGVVAFVVISGADLGDTTTAAIAVALGVLALAHLLVMPQWRYRVHRWEISDTAVYTQSGWITQERRIAPLGRVQTVDIHRGPFEQLFGLSNVTVTTASAKGPIKIHALGRSVAEQAVEWITERAEASAGDAT